jgi:PAS domain S-box-containing protein
VDDVPPTSEQLQREVDDLRRRVDELVASRDRFRDLVESTSDWLWEVDGDGKYTYVSPQVRNVLGREVDDLTGTAPFDIMPPAEAERVASIFQHFVSRAEPFERIENVCLHADGREVVMETSGVPVYGPDGGLQGYRGVDRDITARKQAEEALGEERLLAQTYLNLAGVIFVAIDASGTVTLVNQKACEVLGYSEEQIVGRNWFDTCLPPRLKETVKDVARQVLGGDIEPVEYFENPILTSSGAERIIAWHNTTLRDGSGCIAGTLSSGEDITERKRAEEELRNEKEFTETALDSQLDTFFLFEPATGKAIRWNRAFNDVTGYTDEEIASMKAPDSYYSPEDMERASIFIQEVIETGTGTIELDLICKDGHTVPTEYKVSAIKDAEGKTEYFLSIGRDVTDRNRTEQALRKSEAVLNAAGRMANVGGWELVPETMEVRWTDQIYHIYGIPVGQMPPLEENLSFYHPDDRPSLITGLQRAIDHGEPYDLELRFTTAQGRDLWVHTLCRPVVENGKTVLLQGTFQDITERKQAEEALQASEDNYRTLVSHTPAVLWSSDENGHTSFISSNVEQVYGYTPKEIIESGDRLWFGRIHPEDLADVKAGYAAMIERDEPFDIEYRIQKQDGDWIWLHDRGTRSHEIDGKLCVHGVFLDITDRKRAEEQRDHLEAQLRQAQKMEAVGQLAGGIAHDFNNILTAIMGNAELLKMDLPAEGRQATFTDGIIKGAARAADLTRQLLAFARKGKRQVVPVDIHNIVHQTVKMLTYSIDRLIEIRLELHASPSTVMGDPTQLQNTLLNLGVNARDAMTDGGVLTYATRGVTLTETDCDEHPYELTPGDFLEIRVTDTGVGMDEETQKRVFEPFFTTKEVGKGTGLGLAGVYGCIRNHDGSVSVSSQPDQGATFTILLPLVDTGAAAAERTASSDKPIRGTGRVLIVDDEESVRSFVRTSLQNLGYTVSACNDGAAGVDYYREHHQEIDLVILDLIMPRMSGQDAFEEMKKINASARVLVSSGFSHTQATRQMLDEGVLGLLNKPFQITELAQAVAEHIQDDSE